MRRRKFIALIGGATAFPFAADAQQSGGVRRIGVLAGLAENDTNMRARLAGLREGLERRGWVEGRNIRIDYRYAPAGASTQALAKEIVALQPEVILAHTVLPASALQRETRTIPIVFVSIGDPIGAGLIASLARPQGNLTGLMTFEASVAGKWFSMLKEVAPQIKRVAFVGSPKAPTYDYYLRASKAASASLAIELVPIPIDQAADITESIGAFARSPGSGLLVAPDIYTIANSKLIIAMAEQHRLPAVYAFGYLVSAGGLMSYGTDRIDEMRQAAAYIDRILRGDKPADLPVQMPTRFETAINLRTAKALGLTVPSGLLLAADHVIE
jgi:putative ABC transport system substrate-binding protein